jgi:hypothetical protein
VTAPQALLEAAVRCYQRGGDPEGACRCFDLLGAWEEAARLHERAGRSREAAVRYERAGRFLDGARCYRGSGDLEGEVRCWVRGGEPVRAAWVLAHDLGRAHQAKALLQELLAWEEAQSPSMIHVPGTPAYMAPEWARGDPRRYGPGSDIVQARCLVLLGDRRAAARTLRATFPALRALPPGPERSRLSAWALAVAEALNRPDLAAEILTTIEDGPEAERLWDAWAERTFREAVAPPVRLSREALATGPEESETHE